MKYILKSFYIFISSFELNYKLIKYKYNNITFSFSYLIIKFKELNLVKILIFQNIISFNKVLLFIILLYS